MGVETVSASLSGSPSNILPVLPQPFLPAVFPLLSPTQIVSLSTKGFTTFPIEQRRPLHDAATALFSVSRAFFSQPQSDKSQFQIHKANSEGSEEGWSRVVGEKELITLRRGGNTCPPSVENEGRKLWAECGMLMQEMTRGVEQSLGMPPGVFDDVVIPECTMPLDGADRPETLLRMFRYERRSRADDQAESHDEEASGKGRLVAEPHRDLGLLSLVIGASPGLEVFDTVTKKWIPIEEPPHAAPGLTATLLVGHTLTRLTNGRYVAGRHRVFVPSVSTDDESPFRYSLVFALRPYAKAVLSTTALTTPITGTFRRPMEGLRARELFVTLARSHWNINTGHEKRDAQKLQLKGGTSSSISVSVTGLATSQKGNQLTAPEKHAPEDEHMVNDK
ncbi:Clavaminate synthase-like protein [Ramaria rubella]|nr:Clavaminate synthase-like protein [Ramaria rubella]